MARRLVKRRARFDALPWAEATRGAAAEATAAAQWVWTQSAFSEYASGGAFAETSCSSSFFGEGASRSSCRPAPLLAED